MSELLGPLYFPGDRDFFYDLFSIATGLDLVELLIDAYQNDRSGIILAPEYLVHFLSELAADSGSRVLIAEAEKMAQGLRSFISAHREKNFTLTTDRYPIFLLLKTLFEGFDNVHVLNQSIYRELILKDKYDLV